MAKTPSQVGHGTVSCDILRDCGPHFSPPRSAFDMPRCIRVLVESVPDFISDLGCNWLSGRVHERKQTHPWPGGCSSTSFAISLLRPLCFCFSLQVAPACPARTRRPNPHRATEVARAHPSVGSESMRAKQGHARKARRRRESCCWGGRPFQGRGARNAKLGMAVSSPACPVGEVWPPASRTEHNRHGQRQLMR